MDTTAKKPTPVDFFYEQHFNGGVENYRKQLIEHTDNLYLNNDYARVFQKHGIPVKDDFIYSSLIWPEEYKLFSNSRMLNNSMMEIITRNANTQLRPERLSYFFVGCLFSNEIPVTSTFYSDKHLGHIIEFEVRLLKVIRDMTDLLFYYLENKIPEYMEANGLQGDKFPELDEFLSRSVRFLGNLTVSVEKKYDYLSLKMRDKQHDDDSLIAYICKKAYEFVMCHEIAHHLLGHTEGPIPIDSHNISIEKYFRRNFCEYSKEEIDADITGLSLFLGEDIFLQKQNITSQKNFIGEYLIPIHIAFYSITLILQMDYKEEDYETINEFQRIKVMENLMLALLSKSGLGSSRFKKASIYLNAFATLMHDFRKEPEFSKIINEFRILS